MNDIIRQLNNRKSVRQYEDREIDEELVQEILNAASQAPTAGNQQLYTILRITDKDKIYKLSESCDHQPFINSAKLVLVFCADCLKWYEAYKLTGSNPRKPGVGDLMLSVIDTAIAAQNAVTAAESFGIGSCYIGDILENAEVQREILELPEYVIPAVMVVFGYPTQGQKDRKKPERTPLEHLIFENKYPELDEKEIREMLDHNVTTGTFDDWIRAFCKRKYNSDFSIEMTKSVSAHLSQFETIRADQ